MYTASFYEKKKHGTAKFPVAYYYVDHTHPQYNMPFHWHTEWELIRVREGQLVLHVDEQEYYAKEGDVLLLQDSMFHGGAAAAGVYECLVYDFYALFHDVVPVKEFMRPFYRLHLLPHVLYRREEYPEICRIVEEIMDANYTHMISGCINPETGEIPDDATRGEKKTEADSSGYRELITVSGLGRLIAEIRRKELYKVNGQESLRTSHRIGRIKNVLEYVEKHYQSPITLGELAEVAGMNPQYFCRAFKDVTMQSPMDYVIFYRLEQAVRLLAATDLSVMEVAMECGFNDCSYFIRVFKKQKNMTPNQYRKQNKF